ncbi:MAG: molybdopterin-dependent oxidoreductase, partial [Deltaproteobacteria bacterium]|nr:molybdopterin-dependent oxidoreductase [Deltaproteobacteria bacterium]
FTHIQQDFTDAYGTPNYSNHANLCDTSRKSTFKSVIGDERPLVDFESAELLFVWGWNFLSAIKWIHLAAVFQRGMAKPGREFIYVDPVFNTTASKADQWVAPRPGTDGALAMALARHIIASGKYDATYVAKYTLGFDEYAKFLNGQTYDKVVKDSAWAEKICGIPAAEIDALAIKLETAYTAGKKILIDSWSGPGHHTNATQGGRAIVALALLLGAVDKPGSLIFTKRAGPGRRPASGFGWPAKDKWRLDGRDDVGIPQPDGSKKTFAKKYLYSHGSGIYVETIDCMINQKDFLGNDYPIKSCVIVFQNLLMSTPNTQKVANALNKMDFILCVDTHLSETALMADLVSPGSNFLERFDFNAAWVSQRSVGLRQPVVQSWIGGRSEAQFFLDLGQAMGFKGFKDQPGVNDIDENFNKEEWDRFMKTGNGGKAFANPLTWDELKAKGYWSDATGLTAFGQTAAKLTYAAATHTLKKYTVGSEVKYTVMDGASAVGIVTDNSKVIYTAGVYSLPDGTSCEVGFKTTSRYGQFWDPVLNNAYTGAVKPAGIDVSGKVEYLPLPVFTEPLDKPTPAYPLYFLSWKEVEHTHTRTFNNPWLMGMRGENRCVIHPDVATPLGIGEADRVMVETENGLIEARAHISTGIHKECVGWVRGFGHWALGRIAKGKGVHDGWLLKGRAELHSGQAVHKEAGCRIFKVA